MLPKNSFDKNCRSCKMSLPVEYGEWKCVKWNAIIPKEEIPKEKECWDGVY